MVSVQALSNSILKRSFEERIAVSPMKLQKILYFTYREYLQATGQPLFVDCFQVWKYGPVVTAIYDEFKSFRDQPITRFAKNAQGQVMIVAEDHVPDIKQAIQRIWEKCRCHDGIFLSNLTHQSNGAWYQAFLKKESVISQEDIQHDNVTIP